MTAIDPEKFGAGADTLTHFDADGNAVMVDIGAKSDTERIAIAEGAIRMTETTLELILSGSHAKGDVLGVARVAAIMACKRTADLIPLCHPIALTAIRVDFEIIENPPQVVTRVTARTCGPTGVEMEALIGVQIALLTIYDMCKAVDRGMTIQNVRLLEKRGGRSGHWRRDQQQT